MLKEKIMVNTDLTTLRSQLTDEDKFIQGVRLFVVYQVALGKTTRELERLYNTSRKTIYNWVHRYNKHGVEGLVDRFRSGRPPKLNCKQQKSLCSVIRQRPELYGYKAGNWTVSMLNDYIRRIFGVTYTQTQIYNIVRKLGFGLKKGELIPVADSNNCLT